MTAQEKAKELFDKLTPLTRIWSVSEGWVDEKPTAKKCALICVDEILQAFDDCSCSSILPGTFGIKEWQQVKEEINKL